MTSYIYIVEEGDELKSQLDQTFKKEKEYKFKKVTFSNLEIALKNIPDLMIINEDDEKGNIKEICTKIRENDDNNITPVIVVSSETDRMHRLEILSLDVERYIKKPIDAEYLYYTIRNLIRLLQVNRRVSPLTGLPGNVQIQAEMKKRLLNNEEYAMLYLDLDNFKAYNDIYGFMNGDQIIKFTAKVITEHVYKNDKDDNNFVGHIGGDDFVAIVIGDDYEKICRDIIIDFDENVKKFFNKEDRKRGYLEVPNRKGIIEQFPLTSISIGVVEVDHFRFKNTLEIGEAGASVKHLAKTIMGSTYVVDRRKNIEQKNTIKI